jgi:hypothetical protein
MRVEGPCVAIDTRRGFTAIWTVFPLLTTLCISRDGLGSDSDRGTGLPLDVYRKGARRRIREKPKKNDAELYIHRAYENRISGRDLTQEKQASTSGSCGRAAVGPLWSTWIWSRARSSSSA